jgi:HK97 gp10 family phage protein
MGGVWGSIDKKQFEELRKKVEDLTGEETDALMEACVKKLAHEFTRGVKQKTPVDKGVLKGEWDEALARANVEKTNKGFQCVLTNTTPYASYVEWGHRQTPGRYVHAIGKRLKKHWVEGRYMMSKTEAEVNAKADTFIGKQIDKFLEEKLGGK